MCVYVVSSSSSSSSGIATALTMKYNARSMSERKPHSIEITWETTLKLLQSYFIKLRSRPRRSLARSLAYFFIIILHCVRVSVCLSLLLLDAIDSRIWYVSSWLDDLDASILAGYSFFTCMTTATKISYKSYGKSHQNSFVPFCCNKFDVKEKKCGRKQNPLCWK